MPYNPRDYIIETPAMRGPMDLYKDALSLRDLVDQRRVRDLQVKKYELEARQEEQKQQELQNLRDLFRPGKEPTDQEILATAPLAGAKILTERRQAQTAGRQATEAQEKLNDTYRKVAANEAYVLLREPDPERRVTMVTDYLRRNLIKAGVLKPEAEHVPFSVNDDTLWGVYTGGYGADGTIKAQSELAKHFEDRRAAKRTETIQGLETDEKQMGLSGKILGSVTDQGTLDAYRGTVPQWMQPLIPRTFTPDVPKALELMHLTAEQRVQERRAQATADAQATAQQASATNQNLTQVGKTRDDYARESKPYVIVRDAFGSMQAAAKQDTGPGDIGLVFQFFRLQDPGSTVSTGEQATAANTPGIPDQLRVLYNRLLEGKTARLSPNVREQFLAAGRAKFDQLSQSQKGIETFFRNMAERNRMNPQDVLIPYTANELEEQRQQQQPGLPRQTGAPAAGNTGAAPGIVPLYGGPTGVLTSPPPAAGQPAAAPAKPRRPIGSFYTR